MSNLTTRIISGFIALIVLVGTIYFFRAQGLVILCAIIASIGIYEMSLLLFLKGFPRFAKTLFFIVGVLNIFFSHPGLIMGSFILVVLLGLLMHKQFDSLDKITLFVSQFTMGILYAVGLPLLVISLVKAPNGLLWFSCLIAVVFCGDTGAYIAGTLFGKTKIAPLLSPKKSLQGSLGGLFFSALAGFIFSFIIPGVNPVFMALLGLFSGLLGQTGDFFESLIKRVAGVKDSGLAMPGHGGVLDRVDGVYFASPLFFFAVYYIIK